MASSCGRSRQPSSVCFRVGNGTEEERVPNRCELPPNLRSSASSAVRLGKGPATLAMAKKPVSSRLRYEKSSSTESWQHSLHPGAKGQRNQNSPGIIVPDLNFTTSVGSSNCSRSMCRKVGVSVQLEDSICMEAGGYRSCLQRPRSSSSYAGGIDWSYRGMESNCDNIASVPCESSTNPHQLEINEQEVESFLPGQLDQIPASNEWLDLNAMPQHSKVLSQIVPDKVAHEATVEGSVASVDDSNVARNELLDLAAMNTQSAKLSGSDCVVPLNTSPGRSNGLLDLNVMPEQSINVIVSDAAVGNVGEDGRVVPWKTRNRTSKGPDCRERLPGRPTALQQALMKFGQRANDYIIDPAIGTEFDDRQEAYEYYNLYSWEIGFGIRMGKARYSNDKNNRKLPDNERYMLSQEFNCSCSGRPGKNLKTMSSLTDCPAMLRINRTKDNGWVVVAHISEHNHALSESYGEKKQWPSHHHLDKYTKDLVRMLRENNVGITKLYSILGNFFGSMQNVPTTKRCLKNLCQKINREQAQDDINKTLDLFRVPLVQLKPAVAFKKNQ